jgi:hypothetical protein
MSGGTGHLPLIPVDYEVAEVKGAFRVGLPAYAASHCPTEIKGIVALADREQFGIDIACIDDMALWQEALRLQSQKEALDATESTYANPRGYADSIQST